MTGKSNALFYVKIRDAIFLPLFWYNNGVRTTLNGALKSHSSELERLHTHSYSVPIESYAQENFKRIWNSEREKATAESAFQHENDENVYNFLFFSNKH